MSTNDVNLWVVGGWQDCFEVSENNTLPIPSDDEAPYLPAGALHIEQWIVTTVRILTMAM